MERDNVEKLLSLYREKILRPRLGQSGDLENYLLGGLLECLSTQSLDKISSEFDTERVLFEMLPQLDPYKTVPNFIEFLRLRGSLEIGEAKADNRKVLDNHIGVKMPVYLNKEKIGDLAFYPTPAPLWIGYKGRIPNMPLPMTRGRLVLPEEIELSYTADSEGRKDGWDSIPFP